MAACRRTARTRANTCLECWDSVWIYFISLTFVSFLYEPPELTSPQTTTNWPTWARRYMISFLFFGRSLGVYLFSGLFYTKSWFPHPLLATSTPKLSVSNSSHGRSTCASAASCWSVDCLCKPWRFSPEISKPQETLKKIDKQFGDQRLSHISTFSKKNFHPFNSNLPLITNPPPRGHCLCHWLLLPSTRCATTTATTQALEKAPTLKGPGNMACLLGRIIASRNGLWIYVHHQKVSFSFGNMQQKDALFCFGCSIPSDSWKTKVSW